METGTREEGREEGEGGGEEKREGERRRKTRREKRKETNVVQKGDRKERNRGEGEGLLPLPPW